MGVKHRLSDLSGYKLLKFLQVGKEHLAQNKSICFDQQGQHAIFVF